jgi:hypothetical protein
MRKNMIGYSKLPEILKFEEKDEYRKKLMKLYNYEKGVTRR